MNLEAPIKIIIADDHELIRDGLQVMMKKVPAVEILGEAYNGEMLVKMTRKLSPEVILTDIKMPVMDGITAISAIRKEAPGVEVVALDRLDGLGAVAGKRHLVAHGLEEARRHRAADLVVLHHQDRPGPEPAARYRRRRLLERPRIAHLEAEREPEDAALSDRGLHADLAAHRLDQLAADGKPQPGTLLFPTGGAGPTP